jgi:hypothetical protein
VSPRLAFIHVSFSVAEQPVRAAIYAK